MGIKDDSRRFRSGISLDEVPRRSPGVAHLRRFAGVCLAAGLLLLQQTAVAESNHWVTSWGCAPQLTEPGNLPPVPLAETTLRQFIRTTIAGKRVRVRFSNVFGTNEVRIRAAHIALAAGAGSAGNGDIGPSTGGMLVFGGAPDVVIPAGEDVYSDPLDFPLPAVTNVAIGIHFGSISASTVTGHPGSRTTSFVQSGNALTAARLPDAARTAHWYMVTGLEVLAPSSHQAIVVLGDSITDGRGSTTDGNDRWPDHLAWRLSTNPPTAGVSVVNMGIGGNAIFGGLGPAAIKRFDRDVLGQNGARWLIVFEGVNDLGWVSESRASMLATNLIAAYTQFADKAHAQHLQVYGATITPFGGNGYYTPAREAARMAVNSWLRTNSVFDGVIDFDAIVRDPVTKTNLLRAYDTGDHLHLNPAGYRAMADAIDLKLFASE